MELATDLSEFAAIRGAKRLVFFIPAEKMATVKSEISIHASWLKVLEPDFSSDYFSKLKKFLMDERARGRQIFPPGSQIFRAFDMCPFDSVRVVILGQDPYHGPGQAHGLCFSVPQGIQPPPSLVNIYKELREDLGIEPPGHGNLEKWARQGVLLLNSSLTVEAHRAGSHSGRGWEQFTDSAIRQLNDKKKGLVFLLWGRPAQNKGQWVDRNRHHVLTAPHPSPLSAHRGFFGCKHFSKTNSLLQRDNQAPIDWSL